MPRTYQNAVLAVMGCIAGQLMVTSAKKFMQNFTQFVEEKSDVFVKICHIAFGGSDWITPSRELSNQKPILSINIRFFHY